MNTIIITFSVVLLSAVVIFVVFKNQQAGNPQKLLLEVVENLRKEISDSSVQNRQEINQRIDKIADQLLRDKNENIQTIQRMSSESQHIIKEVTQKLTTIDATNKQVLDFSSKLQNLEHILKNPKQRGILGEYFLENLLGNVLQPNQYKMQYQFKDGEIVDAAVFYQNKVIPIDAKFSLENYNKLMEEHNREQREVMEKNFRNDVKKRIDETANYIRPKENTTDFALMFIPAEGVYYSLLSYTVGTNTASRIDIIEYAFRKHVIIVSPVSFYAYLETIIMGMRAQQMEESVEEILKRVNELGRHITVYDDYMIKLGKNLGTTVTCYNQAYRELKKIDKDVVKLSDKTVGGALEPMILEKPIDE